MELESTVAAGADAPDDRVFVPAIRAKQNFWVNDAQLLTNVQRAYASYCKHVELEGGSERGDGQAAAPVIPHILHFIWLGSQVPDWAQRNIDTWRAVHPAWEVRVWGDDEVRSFALANKAAFDAAANFGEMSDILRYEILHKHGGCYVDCDMECVNRLDQLHNTVSMYCGMSNTGALEVNNALIGCAPGHPTMAEIILRISRQHQQRELVRRTNIMSSIAGFLGSSGGSSSSSASDGGPTQQQRQQTQLSLEALSTSDSSTIAFSGPGMFTQAVATALQEQYNPALGEITDSTDREQLPVLLMVLPIHVFYPIPNTEPSLHVDDGTRYAHLRSRYITPDTIAVHQWACSWQR